MSLPELTPREHEVAAAECDAIAEYHLKLAELCDGPLRDHLALEHATTALSIQERARHHREKSQGIQADRERLRQAEERLLLAERALVATGYFTEDQVGPDIAPRITELHSHYSRTDR